MPLLKTAIIKIIFALTSALTLGTAQLTAQLLRDDFSQDGSLAGSTPDVGGRWTTIAGTPSQQQVTSGRVRLNAAGNEDVGAEFPAQSSLTLFAGFLLNELVAPVNSGGLAIAFRSAEGAVGRIFLSASTADKFRIGIDNNLDNPVYWPSPLDVSTNYRIVLGFTENGNSDRTMLWVNPTAIGDPSVSEIAQPVTAAVTGFGFFQVGATGQSAVDDLYVGTDFAAAAVPEPSSAGLLAGGLGMLFLSRARMRSRATPL